MADHLLHIPPLYDLKLRAQRHPLARALLKLQCLLHAFISRQAGRAAAAMRGARSMLLDLLSKKAFAKLSWKIKRRRKNKMDRSSNGGPAAVKIHHCLLLPPGASPMPSSCSSSEMAVLSPADAWLSCRSSTYYDPSWSTVTPALVAGYLEWPGEELYPMEDDQSEEEEDGAGCNEIDMLAERFIETCHERFMLEKQESNRMFQEMLARSL